MSGWQGARTGADGASRGSSAAQPLTAPPPVSTCSPYMLTALACAALSLPLGLMKLAVLRHSQWAHTQWPPFIALYALHMLFAVAHVLAAQASGRTQQRWVACAVVHSPRSTSSHRHCPVSAALPPLQRIVEWARNRWDHGLGGWGFPWQEGEEAWLVAGQLQSQAEEGQVAAAAEGSGGDVPAERLADPDSRWVEVGGVRVHYKLALPQVLVQGCCLCGLCGSTGKEAGTCAAPVLRWSGLRTRRPRPLPPFRQGCSRSGGTAVVLVHSFGGGVFSWRHVQQPLADASGLPVLAFDRPGFGAWGVAREQS